MLRCCCTGPQFVNASCLYGSNLICFDECSQRECMQIANTSCMLTSTSRFMMHLLAHHTPFLPSTLGRWCRDKAIKVPPQHVLAAFDQVEHSAGTDEQRRLITFCDEYFCTPGR